jgi:hypothetical protein
MVRIRRCLIILQVARRTCSGSQTIVSVYVTLRTLQRHMRSRQCEACGRVIKASCPIRRSVATLASLREAGLHVIRVASRLIILQVTRRATCVRKRVVLVDVALRALQRHVRASQREAGCRMIKAGVPICSRVTRLASLRESGLHVIRISRALEIFQVT